jgi:hypothetical protein
VELPVHQALDGGIINLDALLGYVHCRFKAYLKLTDSDGRKAWRPVWLPCSRLQRRQIVKTTSFDGGAASVRFCARSRGNCEV